MTFTPIRVYDLVVLLTLFIERFSALCLNTCINFETIFSTFISNIEISFITGTCGV
jgi:hypothetical protein